MAENPFAKFAPPPAPVAAPAGDPIIKAADPYKAEDQSFQRSNQARADAAEERARRAEQRSQEAHAAAMAKASAKESPDQAYSQSALDAFDRAIATANRLKTHPGFNAGVGMPSINPFDGNIATYIVPGSPAADFRAEVDALKAQVFLPMVQSMKGMGALSNAEGQKLTDAIGALDTNMSEEGFKASLERIVGDLKTYRDRGKPQEGGRRAGPETDDSPDLSTNEARDALRTGRADLERQIKGYTPAQKDDARRRYNADPRVRRLIDTARDEGGTARPAPAQPTGWGKAKVVQ